MLTLGASLAFAASSGPSSINVSGGLFNPNGTPVTNASVNFKIEIYDKSGTCLLYSESHLGQDLSSTKGGFSLAIGHGTGIVNGIDTSSPTSMTSKVFENVGAIAGGWTGCLSGTTLADGDERLIRVYYDIGGGLTAMNPDVPITSAAYAMVAETLQGLRPADLLQVHDDMATNLSQTNLENIFSSTNYPRLNALVSGSSTQYMVSNPSAAVGFNNQRITDVADPSSAQDVATKNYSDSYIGGKTADLSTIGPAMGDGETLIWDQGAQKWVTGVPSATDNTKLPLSGGTMAGAIDMDGNDISATGHITMSPQRVFNLGTFDNAQETTLIGTLGAGQAGASWYNSQDKVFKIWDGGNAITQAYLAGGKLDAGWFPTSGVVGGSYGSATEMPTFTVGADGRLTAAANVTISGVTPGGSAGGDLTGTYPDPTIADDAVTTAKIKSSGGGKNLLLMTDAITGSTVGFATCGPNEILRYEGTEWACRTIAALLGTSGVTADTYGDATNVAQVTVDAQGRVTSAADVPIDFPVTKVNGKTGDITLDAVDLGLGTAALRNIGTDPGEVPELDGTGRIPSSLLPSITYGDLVNGSGKYMNYKPNDSACADGGVLKWDNTNSQWICGTDNDGASGGTAGGDLTGTYPNPTIASNAVTTTKINDNAVTTAKISDGAVTTIKIGDGQVTDAKIDTVSIDKVVNGATKYLAYKPNDSACSDGGVLKWDNTNSRWICGTDNDGATGGTAGGDLTGTYPNPTIVTNAVTTAKIKDGAITTVKIGDGQVTDAKIDTVSIDKITSAASKYLTYKPNNAACADGGVLKWDNTNSQWICGTDNDGSSGGAAGGDLTGTYPNPTIADNAVVTTKINDSAVTTAKIDDGAITAIKIGDGQVTDAKIDSVSIDKINSAVSKYFTYKPNNAACADGGVLKWDNTSSQWICGTDNDGSSGGTAGGDLTGIYPNPTIASSAVTTAKINDSAVTTDKINDGAVTTIKIGDGQVTDAKIDTMSVDKIINGATKYLAYKPNDTACVDGGVLKWDNTNSRWICGTDNDGATGGTAGGDLTGTYPNPTIADGKITTPKLFSNPGPNRLVATDNTSGATLTPFECSGTQIMQWSGSGWACTNVSAALGTGYIVDGGNSRGAELTVGTNDNFALNFEINDSTKMKIDTSGNVGIGVPTPDAKLHLMGTGTGNSLATSGTTDATINSRICRGSVCVDTGMLDNGNGYIQNHSYADLSLNWPLLLNPNGGNVGIGTPNPATKLDVNGTINATAMTINGVPVSAGTGDNLGNHTASQNLNLAGFQLVGNGGSSGLAISSGGNIGIGTTAATVKMQIDQSSTATDFNSITSTDISLYLRNTSNTTNNMNIVSFGDAGGYGVAHIGSINHDQTNHYGKLFFATRGADTGVTTQRMIIDSIGNVGIGTMSPARPLHVNGAMRMTPLAAAPASAAAGDLFIDSTASNALKYYDGSAWQTVGTGSGAGDFMKNGSVAMTGNFNAGGNKVLGNTTASANLTLESTSHATKGNVFINPNGGKIGIGTTSVGSTDFMAIENAGGNNLVIDKNKVGSWVGIGIEPITTLHVSSNESSWGGALFENISDVSDPTFATITSARAAKTVGAGVGTALVMQVSDSARAEYGYFGAIIENNTPGAQSGSIAFYPTKNATRTEAMRMTSSGNVGIGTNNPARLLHVNGPMRLTPAALPLTPAAGDLAFDSGSANALKFYNGSSWQTVGTGSGNGDFKKDGSVAMSGNLKLGANYISNDGGASEGLAFDTSGNANFTGYVGIGTTNPSTNLEIQSVGPRLTFYDTDESADQKRWFLGGAAYAPGTFVIGQAPDVLPGDINSNSGYAKLSISPAGNVGIGTANPISLLDVASSISGDNGVSLSTSATGSAPFLTWRTADTTNKTYGMRLTGGSSSTFEIGAGDQNGWAPHLTILPANGNVGIGTTTPSDRLHLYRADSSGLTIESGATGAPARRSLVTLASSDANRAQGVLTKVGGTEGWFFGQGYATSDYTIGYGSSQPEYAAQSKMAITTTGNIGIGTTVPAYKLTVKTSTNEYGLQHTDGTIDLRSWVGTTGGVTQGWLGTMSNHGLMLGANAGNNFFIAPSGYVGIGTSNPTQRLDVNGVVRSVAPGSGSPSFNAYSSGGTNFAARLGSWNGDNGAVALYNSSGTLTSLIATATNSYIMGGNVGIGTNSPAKKLHVSNSVNNDYAMQITNGGGTGYGLLINAGSTGSATAYPLVVNSWDGTNLFYVRGDGTYYHSGAALSTKESKKEIRVFDEDALGLLNDIQVVSYRYKMDSEDHVPRVGFLANDENHVYDERLTNRQKGFATETIVGVMIKAIQQVTQKIDEIVSTLMGHDERVVQLEENVSYLKNQIEKAETENQELRARLERLESLLNGSSARQPASPKSGSERH